MVRGRREFEKQEGGKNFQWREKTRERKKYYLGVTDGREGKGTEQKKVYSTKKKVMISWCETVLSTKIKRAFKGIRSNDYKNFLESFASCPALAEKLTL